MEPVIEFTLTNVRKDEVNVSAIKVVHTKEGQKTTAILHTEPAKGESFRLQGQEQVTFTAAWEDIFPDGPGGDDGYGINDLEDIYVEIISTGTRWTLSSLDLWEIREAIEPTLKYRREKTQWVLTCRSCKQKTSWQARPPKADGGFSFGGLGEEKGWTAPDFPRYFPMNATALCPACSAEGEPVEPSNDTVAAE
jgi:hypothetical protein